MFHRQKSLSGFSRHGRFFNDLVSRESAAWSIREAV
jgi:hypothetical protein